MFLIVDFEKRLRELRQERNWTQGQVASRIGVTASLISAYENGLRQPSYAVLLKLTQLYHVSSDYLLGISGKRSAEARNLISLDGLTPAKIALVAQLVEVLKE